MLPNRAWVTVRDRRRNRETSQEASKLREDNDLKYNISRGDSNMDQGIYTSEHSWQDFPLARTGGGSGRNLG